MSKLKDEYEKTRSELNVLLSKQERLNGLVDQAGTFLLLADKTDLSVSEKLTLEICRQTLQNNNISDRSDIEHLKTVQQETDKKIAVLRKTFEDCENLYKTYSDIDKTYYDISKGDYISKIVEEERKMKNRKADKNKSK